MAFDDIEIIILEDGRIKVTADKVSSGNHTNADNFLGAMQRMAGGRTARRRRIGVAGGLAATFHDHIKDGHVHEHVHDTYGESR
jgi:hypothetical protein